MLNQPVYLSFGSPPLRLSTLVHSATTVRCPDCGHRLLAPYEHGDAYGLLDVPATQRQLADHARESSRPHPKLLGPAPLPRSA